jgi:lipopolysaccharide transport system permease protein
VLIGGANTGWALITLPLWIAVIAAQALGLGLVLSALLVRYRDVQYILPIATQLLLFASPVAYALAKVPTGIRTVFAANPLTGVLEAFRWSILGGQDFPLSAVISIAYAIVLLAAGLALFARMERQFADVI